MKRTNCNRIWEIDALRGHLILWVMIYHVYTMVCTFCADGSYQDFDAAGFSRVMDALRSLLGIGKDGGVDAAPFYRFCQFYHLPAVAIFFIVSGVSTRFSRNTLKNSLRLVVGAVSVSAFTAFLEWSTGDSHFVRFGVLHCYAACHLLYCFLLEGRSDKVMGLTAVTSLFLGHLLKLYPIHSNFALLVPFGISEHGAVMLDYWPLFPMLGWFLIGVVLGRHLYPERKTIFPEQANKNWHRPLCFLGRHSGLFYCGHMVICAILFYGIGCLAKLL